VTRLTIRVLFVAVISLIVACSDDKCPVCFDEPEVTAILLAVYTDPWGPHSAGTAFEAAFFGDPIPQVQSVLANDDSLRIADDALVPFYIGECDTFVKHVEMVANVNSTELRVGITLPDSFAIVEPEDNSIAQAGEPLTIRWSPAQGATSYRLGILIFDSAYERVLDTMYVVDSLSYTIPAEYIVEGYDVAIQMFADNGPAAQAGEAGNIDINGFVGYAIG
jgi:hypothetical protein